jgi:hypothetical protein
MSNSNNNIQNSEKISKILLENTNIPNNILNETSSIDIKGTQQILLKLIEEKYNDSLLWKICDILPLKSTLGRVYVQKKKYLKDEFEVVKKDIIPQLYDIETGFTREAYQDMLAMYGKEATKSVAEIFRGLMDWFENEKLMAFLDSNAVEQPELVLEGDVDNDIQLITTTIAKYIIAMNHKSYKTLEGWCILPWEYASLFLGYWMPFRGEQEVENSEFLYIGRFGKIDYYIDPRKSSTINSEFSDDYTDDYALGDIETVDYIYIGMKSSVPGYGSLIFAPYQYNITEVTDPDTGHSKMFLWNRYGLEISPFHNILEQKHMLYKFKVSRNSTP